LRLPLRYLATLLMLLAAGLFAACGGSGEVQVSFDEQREEAMVAATPEEPAAEVASAPADALADLESYRLNLRLTLEGIAEEDVGLLAVDLEAAFVAPDRSQTRVSARLDELELEEESISIGDETWVKVGDSWVAGEAQFELDDLSPASLLEELSPEQLRLLKPSKETVNGVDSLRYSIGRGDIDALRGLGALLGPDEDLENLPEDFDIDLWLAEDGGWPVRITMTARGAIDENEEMNLDFSLDVTDVNDPDIKVEPPEA
jgi:hypothetical protein